jgi:hypothetical protein
MRFALLLALPVWGQTPPAVYSAVYAGATVTCQRVYVAAADFRSAAVVSMLPILTVPDGWTPVSIQLAEALPFTATSPRVTSLTVSLGTLQQLDWYVPALPLTGSARAEVLAGNPPTNARHTLYAALSCVNRDPDDISSLSAGLLEVEVCGTVLLPQIVPPPPPPVPPVPPPAPPPTPPPTCTTVGILVGGVCRSQGTGWHLDAASNRMVPNEIEGNCCLP